MTTEEFFKVIKPFAFMWKIPLNERESSTDVAYISSIPKETRKNCFRYLKLMSSLKNNYLTLRSKVKVPRRSLLYATHCLVVMLPHAR